MTQASVKYLRHIRTKYPDSRLIVWQRGLGQSSSWSIEVCFNAITSVLVTEIKYEDLTEVLLDDDFTPAILHSRKGGHFVELTYKQAKELTKALQS